MSGFIGFGSVTDTCIYNTVLSSNISNIAQADLESLNGYLVLGDGQ